MGGDWGFITSEQHPGDIYVRSSECLNLQTPLSPGDSVEFDLDHRPGTHNGARATNVTRSGGCVPPATLARPSVSQALVPYHYAPAPQQQFAKGAGKGVPVGPIS